MCCIFGVDVGIFSIKGVLVMVDGIIIVMVI